MDGIHHNLSLFMPHHYKNKCSLLLKRLQSINHKACETVLEYHLINKMFNQLTEQSLLCYFVFNQAEKLKSFD